ncbi:MAG: LexA family transcriptional regulator [Cytophagaceae bacterium]|nr:LexA family transcriptional regulator [Cytophagaceae bacterium]MDW8455518.1 LexA family transcriptional regulator [Cytophagaceae bacterium]
MKKISANIRYLRKKNGWTQEELSEKLGIKRSLLGAYEEGRAEPNLNTLLQISKLFNYSLEKLIGQDISEISEYDDFAEYSEGKHLRVLSITLDNKGKENLHLVPQKASAGYLNGLADPEYVSELPVFHLPIFTNGTYRAFEIKGDSMLPIPSGSIIIGEYVENWKLIKDDKTYIIVSAHEGIVYKRVQNLIKQKNALKLISDNKLYESYEIPIEDVHEIWEAKAYISTEFPVPDMTIDKLTSMVVNLQNQIKELKSGK